MKILKYIVAGVLTLIATIWTGAYVYITSSGISTNIANDLAMKQMSNSELSSVGIQSYSYMVNVINQTPIILIVLWLITILFVIWVVRSGRKTSQDVKPE